MGTTPYPVRVAAELDTAGRVGLVLATLGVLVGGTGLALSLHRSDGSAAGATL